MINLKTPSWCDVKGSPPPTTKPGFITKASREPCHVCGMSSKQVFEAGWTCLNEKCTNFSTNHNVHQGTRSWNPAFVNERNEWPEYIKPPMPLKPAPPINSLNGSLMETSLQAWKGMVCRDCGRCNSRTLHQQRRSRRLASQLQRGSAELGIQEPRPPKRDLS